MTEHIDVHHHILPSFYHDALIAAKVPERYGISFPKWSVDSSKKVMDKCNIESAITSVTMPAVCFGNEESSKKLARQCNDYAAELSAKHPQTFGSFATLPLPHIDAAIEELIHALDELKMEGVTLLSNYDGMLLGNKIFHPLFHELNKRHSTVFMHPTVPSPCCSQMSSLPVSMFEFMCDSSRTVISMLFSGVFEKYSNIKFIIPHAGGAIPYLAGRINVYEITMPSIRENIPKGAYYYLKNLYYDLAASASIPTLRCLNEFVGAENILVGTDYPFIVDTCIEEQFKALDQYPYFSDSERELVCYKNMERLFPRFR